MVMVRNLQTFPITVKVVAETCFLVQNEVYDINTPIKHDEATTPIVNGASEMSNVIDSSNIKTNGDKIKTGTMLVYNTLSHKVIFTVSTTCLI